MKESVFTAKAILASKRSITVSLKEVKEGFWWAAINVYCPHKTAGISIIWDDLQEIRHSLVVRWCIGKYFSVAFEN